MAKLSDYLYLSDLVKRIQSGNDTAFSELYLTTYPKIYEYAWDYLRDDGLAKQALENTYTEALKNIFQVQEPSLILTWLYYQCFKTCYDMKPQTGEVSIDRKTYYIGNILNLPFSESQVLLMTYLMGMKVRTIAKKLGMSRNVIRHYLTIGKRHLSNAQF